MEKKLALLGIIVTVLALATGCGGLSAETTGIPGQVTVTSPIIVPGQGTATSPATVPGQATATSLAQAVTQTPGGTSAVTPGSTASAITQAAQVAAGKQVYTQNCASCHGDNLQGVDAPALNPSTLGKYNNAQNLYQFISTNMPLGAPGSLSQQQYLEAEAFILDQNNLLPAGEALTLQDASQISLTQAAPATTGTAGATSAVATPAITSTAVVPTP